MSYQVELQRCPDYIRAEVTGVRQPVQAVSDAHLVGRQIVAECRDTGIEKILLVLQLTGRMTALDAYEIVVDSQEYGWSRSFRLAYVDLNTDSCSDSLFTETVAVNRAFQLKVFDNEHDATEWLLNP